MTSEESVQQAAMQLLGSPISSATAQKISKELISQQQISNVPLSAEGYIYYLLCFKGAQAVLPTTQTSKNNVMSYAGIARSKQESFPRLLLNSVQYLQSAMEMYGSIDKCIPILRTMSEDPVLYMLLVQYFPEHAGAFRTAAIREFRRYPGIADTLTEPFKGIARALMTEEVASDGSR